MATIANPNAAYRTVTDYSTGKDASGAPLEYDNDVTSYRANAAITRGQALNLVAPTSTVPVSVTPMAAATADRLFVGAAMEAAAAGEQVRVVRRGNCLVNAGAGTFAAAEFLFVPATTTGVFDNGAAPAITNTTVGVIWGVKDANNLAFAYIDASGLPSPDEVA